MSSHAPLACPACEFSVSNAVAALLLHAMMTAIDSCVQAGRGRHEGPESVTSSTSHQDKHAASHIQDWNAQIEKDLHRTFPGLPVMDSTGRRGLRHVLAAYACRNPAVGYCQVRHFPPGHANHFI